jgi:hypothetical protein
MVRLDSPAQREADPVEARVTIRVEDVAEAPRRVEQFHEGYDARNGRGNPDRHG